MQQCASRRARVCRPAYCRASPVCGLPACCRRMGVEHPTEASSTPCRARSATSSVANASSSPSQSTFTSPLCQVQPLPSRQHCRGEHGDRIVLTAMTTATCEDDASRSSRAEGDLQPPRLTTSGLLAPFWHLITNLLAFLFRTQVLAERRGWQRADAHSSSASEPGKSPCSYADVCAPAPG